MTPSSAARRSARFVMAQPDRAADLIQQARAMRAAALRGLARAAWRRVAGVLRPRAHPQPAR